jgi:ligand-binding sensor domain-containing protein/AraC-like DNA-binding protein
MRHLWTGIISILFFFFPSWALEPDKPLDEYLVDHWNTSGGVPSNLIHAITQTPDGYLWVATNRGLVRFDGITFAPVQAAVSEALYIDKSGILWIGGSDRLISYDHQTRRFTNYTTADGLGRGKVRRLFKDMNGNLWIGFISNFLNRFSTSRFTAFTGSGPLKNSTVNAIVEDQAGNLLIGTRDNGVFQYRDGQFIPYPIPGLKGYLVNMREDHKGSLWISTSEGLLKKTGNTVETFTSELGLSIPHTTDILEDSQHTLWIGSTKGLNRLKTVPGGDIGFEHILESHVIVCLFEDREGSIWIGTYDSGLFRLKDRKFNAYIPFDTGEGEVLFSMCRDTKGNTWIGTGNGKLYRSRDNGSAELIDIPGLSGAGISAISTDDDGTLWIGTNGKGVFHKKNGNFFHYTKGEGLPDDLVTVIFPDSRGNMWFGTFNGAAVFHPGRSHFESINSHNGLMGRKVYSICEDNAGGMWIGTDNGVTVFTGREIETGNIAHYLEGVIVTWTYQDPIPPGNSGNVFWIATHGAGLKRLCLNNRTTATSYTTSDGMATDFIYKFFEDRQGYLWLMSDSGILRLNKSGLNRFASGETERIDCSSFDESDGLISPEFNNPFSRHTAFRTETGELWFLTKKGISNVDPETVRINKLPPTVIIEEAIFDEKTVPLPINPETGTFKDIINIQFRFTATTLLSAEKAVFKYRLEGVDKKWVFLPPGKERVVRYKNLEPAMYTFRVTASNADGVWNDTGAKVTFTLGRSFSRTLLFRIIVFFMVVFLLVVGVYIYNAYKKRLSQKKEEVESEPKVSLLARPFVEECVKKLRHLMEVEKAYRDGTLSLRNLADRMSIPYYQLSQILNDELKRSFPDFVNHYRIEEAKEILKGPVDRIPKIASLAHDVGFNSLTAFYKAFKKQTGMTPNVYRRVMPTA